MSSTMDDHSEIDYPPPQTIGDYHISIISNSKGCMLKIQFAHELLNN